MPYIPVNERTRLSRFSGPNEPSNAGELNYKFARLIDAYCDNMGLKYQTINDVVGVLVCLKDEFQRRFTNIYEDMKRMENGEVFVYMADRIREYKNEDTK